MDNGYIWDQTRGARASDPPGRARSFKSNEQSALPLELDLTRAALALRGSRSSARSARLIHVRTTKSILILYTTLYLS